MRWGQDVLDVSLSCVPVERRDVNHAARSILLRRLAPAGRRWQEVRPLSRCPQQLLWVIEREHACGGRCNTEPERPQEAPAIHLSLTASHWPGAYVATTMSPSSRKTFNSPG